MHLELRDWVTLGGVVVGVATVIWRAGVLHAGIKRQEVEFVAFKEAEQERINQIRDRLSAVEAKTATLDGYLQGREQA